MKLYPSFIVKAMPLLACALFCALSFFLGTVLYSPASLASSLPLCSRTIQESSVLSDSLLRIRILASSDSKQDQSNKLLVRDQLLEALTPLLSGLSTKEEAIAQLTPRLSSLAGEAQALLKQHCCEDPVQVELTCHYFPLKTYGDMTFPSGYYDTLLVTIGNGLGSNWWCMAFPPLCFVDEITQEVPESSRETLQSLLPQEVYESLFTKPVPLVQSQSSLPIILPLQIPRPVPFPGTDFLEW